MTHAEGLVANLGVFTYLEACQGQGEDRMAWLESDQHVVLAIADGAGGMSGGAAAAQLAIELAMEHAQQTSNVFDEKAWTACLCEIDVQVTARSNAGETTLLVLATDGIRIAGAASGDSQALLFNLPIDYQVYDGSETGLPIGSGDALPIAIRKTFVGSCLLAATKGLWNHTNSASIAGVLADKTPDEVGQALAELVRLRSGALPDDCGVFVVTKRAGSPVPPQAVAKPKLAFAVPIPR